MPSYEDGFFVLRGKHFGWSALASPLKGVILREAVLGRPPALAGGERSEAERRISRGPRTDPREIARLSGEIARLRDDRTGNEIHSQSRTLHRVEFRFWPLL